MVVFSEIVELRSILVLKYAAQRYVASEVEDYGDHCIWCDFDLIDWHVVVAVNGAVIKRDRLSSNLGKDVNRSVEY